MKLAMATPDTPEAPRYRIPRYHAILLAAFLRGGTVDEAAAAAGISRRQTLRWKARHGADLEDARAHLVDAAQAQLREALPATAESVARSARDIGAAVPTALRRLLEILEKPEADLTHVRLAATALLDASARASALAFEVHAKLSERIELEQRIGRLEAAVAARASQPTGARNFTTILGGGAAPRQA